MSAVTWAALAFFLVVLVGGSAVVGWLGFVLWRQVRASLATGSQAVDELATGMEALDARLQGIEGKTTELESAAALLSQSVGRARILLAAAQESRNAIAGWLRFLPRT